MSEEVVAGAFFESLRRNNAKIKADRAAAISEDTELVYKRQIEDLQIAIKRMKRDQDNMLDLSPTDARSLVLAADFDCDEYVKADLDIGVKIRNTEIKLEIAQKRYEFLFGGQEGEGE
jgi:hypothetical protein